MNFGALPPMSPSILLIAGLAICSALLSGLLFVFSSFAMRAFSRIPAASGVAVMQSINATIMNPGFLGLFAGAGTGSIVALAGAVMRWPHPASGWVASGAVVLLVGLYLITAAINVPLNNRLDAVDANGAEAAGAWRRYVSRWQPWNHVRTAACLLSAACYAMGALVMAGA